jgi:uncharacterized protein YecA (UPF0149 family)
MDVKTGAIYEGAAAEIMRRELEQDGRQLLPLSEREHEELKPLGARHRKNKMRNKPCVCGSGKKFKRCCWSAYG